MTFIFSGGSPGWGPGFQAPSLAALTSLFSLALWFYAYYPSGFLPERPFIQFLPCPNLRVALGTSPSLLLLPRKLTSMKGALLRPQGSVPLLQVLYSPAPSKPRSLGMGCFLQSAPLASHPWTLW